MYYKCEFINKSGYAKRKFFASERLAYSYALKAKRLVGNCKIFFIRDYSLDVIKTVVL